MKIISCSQAVTRIFEYLDSALTDSRKKQLDEHLQVCRHCCDRFEFEKLLQEKVREIAQNEQAPKHLVAKIENIVKKF